ncbi:uncharacterized protein K441DRAFT_39948 [Cenococcum geophilum 1.58]|uniref:uncharacterized protein n=1 Tax=Cenococcum geophilum 1.58 TaxID=794803 RepID=UPI00358E3A7D|nr:hypothetical protein K441DRAFT_39948 [Cenococcum geophilum 1.58]
MDTVSSHWIGTRRYEEGEPLHERVMTFVQKVNWEAVLQICRQRRANMPFRLQENFNVSHFNLIRHIVFDDGDEWVIKLRLPELSSIFGTRELPDVESVMRCEIASMKYLR